MCRVMYNKIQHYKSTSGLFNFNTQSILLQHWFPFVVCVSYYTITILFVLIFKTIICLLFMFYVIKILESR